MKCFRIAPILFICFVGGCSGPQFASVEGVVTLDDKPLADVEVQFIPDPAVGTNGPPASAYTDRDGRYQIAATGASGAIVGKHRVCINDATIMMPGGGQTEADADMESGIPGRNAAKQLPKRPRVPTVYSDATRTPIPTVEIQPGTQTRNFTLKSKP